MFLDIMKGAEHGDRAFETEENMERIREFLNHRRNGFSITINRY